MVGNENWLSQSQQPLAGGFRGGLYNDGVGGIVPQQGYSNYYVNGGYMPAYNQFPQQQMMPVANPYASIGYGNNPWMGMGVGYNMPPNPMSAFQVPMGAPQEPLSQGQVDMVERWRQSVFQ